MSDNNIVDAGAAQQKSSVTLVALLNADTKQAGVELAALLAEGKGEDIKKTLELTAEAGRRAQDILSAALAAQVGEELATEFRAIDEQTRADIVAELRKELKAIDAEWHPKILGEAQAKAQEELKAAAKAFQDAAQKCAALGAISHVMVAPSADVIGVATGAAIAGAPQQRPGTELCDADAAPAVTAPSAAPSL